jgi:hypothetical protein
MQYANSSINYTEESFLKLAAAIRVSSPSPPFFHRNFCFGAMTVGPTTLSRMTIQKMTLGIKY